RWRSRAGGPAHREGAEEPQQQEPGRDRDGEAGTVGEDLDQLVEGAGRGVLRPQLRQYRARRVGQRMTVTGGLAGDGVTAGGEAAAAGDDLDELFEGAGCGVLRAQLRQYRARRVGQRLTVPGGLAGEGVTAGGEAGGEHRTRYRGAERGAQLAHGGLRGRALP